MTREEELRIIKDYAAKKNMELNVLPETIFIKTKNGEWFFSTRTYNNIKLFHYNYYYNNRSNKFKGNYHMQCNRFSSWVDIIKYIDKHDSNFYKRKY